MTAGDVIREARRRAGSLRPSPKTIREIALESPQARKVEEKVKSEPKPTIIRRRGKGDKPTPKPEPSSVYDMLEQEHKEGRVQVLPIKRTAGEVIRQAREESGEEQPSPWKIAEVAYRSPQTRQVEEEVSKRQDKDKPKVSFFKKDTAEQKESFVKDTISKVKTGLGRGLGRVFEPFKPSEEADIDKISGSKVAAGLITIREPLKKPSDVEFVKKGLDFGQETLTQAGSFITRYLRPEKQLDELYGDFRTKGEMIIKDLDKDDDIFPGSKLLLAGKDIQELKKEQAKDVSKRQKEIQSMQDFYEEQVSVFDDPVFDDPTSPEAKTAFAMTTQLLTKRGFKVWVGEWAPDKLQVEYPALDKKIEDYSQIYKPRDKPTKVDPSLRVFSSGAITGFVRAPFVLGATALGFVSDPGKQTKEIVSGVKQVPGEFILDPAGTTGEIAGMVAFGKVAGAVFKPKNVLDPKYSYDVDVKLGVKGMKIPKKPVVSAKVGGIAKIDVYKKSLMPFKKPKLVSTDKIAIKSVSEVFEPGFKPTRPMLIPSKPLKDISSIKVKSVKIFDFKTPTTKWTKAQPTYGTTGVDLKSPVSFYKIPKLKKIAKLRESFGVTKPAISTPSKTFYSTKKFKPLRGAKVFEIDKVYPKDTVYTGKVLDAPINIRAFVKQQISYPKLVGEIKPIKFITPSTPPKLTPTLTKPVTPKPVTPKPVTPKPVKVKTASTKTKSGVVRKGEQLQFTGQEQLQSLSIPPIGIDIAVSELIKSKGVFIEKRPTVPVPPLLDVAKSGQKFKPFTTQKKVMDLGVKELTRQESKQITSPQLKIKEEDLIKPVQVTTPEFKMVQRSRSGFSPVVSEGLKFKEAEKVLTKTKPLTKQSTKFRSIQMPVTPSLAPSLKLPTTFMFPPRRGVKVKKPKFSKRLVSKRDYAPTLFALSKTLKMTKSEKKKRRKWFTGFELRPVSF